MQLQVHTENPARCGRNTDALVNLNTKLKPTNVACVVVAGLNLYSARLMLTHLRYIAYYVVLHSKVVHPVAAEAYPRRPAFQSLVAGEAYPRRPAFQSLVAGEAYPRRPAFQSLVAGEAYPRRPAKTCWKNILGAEKSFKFPILRTLVYGKNLDDQICAARCFLQRIRSIVCSDLRRLK